MGKRVRPRCAGSASRVPARSPRRRRHACEKRGDSGVYADRVCEALERRLAALDSSIVWLKQCALVYQYDLKREAARFNGVAPDAYDHLQYEQWDKIRAEYLRGGEQQID